MSLHRAQVLFWGSLGFVIGVTSVFVLEPRRTIWTCVALSFVCVGIVGYCIQRRKSVVNCARLDDVRYWCTAILLSAVFVVVGVLHCDHTLHQHDHYGLAGESVTLHGEVARQPIRSEKFLNFEVQEHGSDLRVLVRGAKYAGFSLGDELGITCVLKAPEVFNGFNYPRYLQMRGVHYLCDDAEVTLISPGTGFLARIARFRTMIEADLNTLIRSPESGLASGLLFGGDDRLSQKLQDAFSRTGMSHIVAVSGYNVSVIIMVITVVGIYLGLWRRQASILSIIAIVLFVAMIGFPSSGVRAAVMGMIVLCALIYGRAVHAFGVVIFAAALMLVWNPLQIAYDVGFQLSFGAVLGIMAFVPVLEHFVQNYRKIPFIVEILFVTISAQLFVLPIIVYHFMTFSSVSLLTNLFVLPILPFTMFFVFVTAVMSQIWFPIAFFFALISQVLLAYEIAVITYFAERSWSSVEITEFSWVLAVLYYSFLVGITAFFNHKGLYRK